MSWNPVMNKFLEMKEAFVEKFGEADLYAYDQQAEACLDYWARKLDVAEYTSLIKPLQLNEYGDLLLVRYGNYADVFGGEEDVTFDDFWNMYDGFYLECRSVVINIKEDTLVLTPFKKFRNLNECEENSYENIAKRIREAKCVEFSDKLDGSMQCARWYKDQMILAGSMSLNPEMSWRLEDGYRMLNEKKGYALMLQENPDKTFVFEYISMQDAHVVKYTKEQEGLHLIGVRDVNTGTEASYADVLAYATAYELPSTQVFKKTLDQVVSELDEKQSSEAEGFVVNIDGYRVKIKYNDYVNMHHMLSAISSINLIIRNIADNTFDDMLGKVPSAYRDRVLKVANFVFGYVHDTQEKINTLYEAAPKSDKKTYMIWVNENAPKELQAYLREKYLGRSYNLIKTVSGRYKKLTEMGLANNTDIFEE